MTRIFEILFSLMTLQLQWNETFAAVFVVIYLLFIGIEYRESFTFTNGLDGASVAIKIHVTRQVISMMFYSGVMYSLLAFGFIIFFNFAVLLWLLMLQIFQSEINKMFQCDPTPLI